MTTDFAIMPASFVPMGMGIEPDLRAFDYVHKDDFAKRYSAARWDLKNIQTDIVVDDEGDLQPITTFSIAVTNGTELTVVDGIGTDCLVLPSSAQFAIAESQHLALEEHSRAIESPNHDNESE